MSVYIFQNEKLKLRYIRISSVPLPMIRASTDLTEDNLWC